MHLRALLALPLVAMLGGCSAEVDEDDAGEAATTSARTSCVATAHLGDSLSAQTLRGLEREYKARGVTRLTLAAYGGRAIGQKVSADPETGRDAARRIVASGFSGCWVVALGTNDTANIARGGGSRSEAIDRLMRAIDPGKRARVMWVDTFTTKRDGYWSNDNMELWNEALEGAKARWPNLVVYRWSDVAATGTAPYVDAIHHTTAGYAVRNKAIADALARTFPE